MKGIYGKEHSFMSPYAETSSVHPIAAYYYNNQYIGMERAYPPPATGNAEEWDKWRADLRGALRKAFTLDRLGTPPTPSVIVLEETRVEAASDGAGGSQTGSYTRKRIAYESMPGNWVSAYLLIPDGAGQNGRKEPAALCPHGHFDGGSDSVVLPEAAAGMAYGHALCLRGLVVLAPDNAGMGRRDVPEEDVSGQTKGGCDLLYRRLNHIGLDITGLRVFELMTALNILCAMDIVDQERIGMAGLSGGCWLTQVTAALDTRVKAAVLSGYFSTFAQTAWNGHCVCHHTFGIGSVCEMPDISSLIAPRPQFVESGDQDIYYPAEPAGSLVREAYRLAGADENFVIHTYEGGHQFCGEKSIPWLVEQLKG